MKKPNFFIIGAPKCGTTSFAKWLGEHPNIFISPIKEPCFFDSDHKHSLVKNINEYDGLFARANNKHIAVGEASTRYLVSEVAVNRILKYNEKAKIVVCLRNPIKMVQSLHQQEVFSGNEHINDFESAWKYRQDNHQSKLSKDNAYLDYRKVCSLGSQCEKLLNTLPLNQVHFILLDNLKENPLRVYKDLLQFLDVAYKGRQDFTAKNSSKEIKYRSIQQAITLLSRVKRKLGIKRSSGIYKLNAKKIERKAISTELQLELEEYFKPEILKLEKILNRDLSHWFQYSKNK